jgi:hypothetical protein
MTMRNILLASALFGGLFMLSGTPASASPANGLLGLHAPPSVTSVDYWQHHHHWHHRRWDHGRWHYWD